METTIKVNHLSKSYADVKAVADLLKQFRLSDKLKSLVSELSGGQKQRIYCP